MKINANSQRLYTKVNIYIKVNIEGDIVFKFMSKKKIKDVHI